MATLKQKQDHPQMEFLPNQFHFANQSYSEMPNNITTILKIYFAQIQIKFSCGHFIKHLAGTKQQTSNTMLYSGVWPGDDPSIAPTCSLHPHCTMPCLLCTCLGLADHGMAMPCPFCHLHHDLLVPLLSSLAHLVP